MGSEKKMKTVMTKQNRRIHKMPGGGGEGRGKVKKSKQLPLSLSFSIIKQTTLHTSKNIWPEDESQEVSCIRKDAYKNLAQRPKHSKGKK